MGLPEREPVAWDGGGSGIFSAQLSHSLSYEVTTTYIVLLLKEEGDEIENNTDGFVVLRLFGAERIIDTSAWAPTHLRPKPQERRH